MGVNLWGERPLYENPVNVLNTSAKVLAEGKGKTARCCLKEAGVQSYEPEPVLSEAEGNRNSI